MSTEEKRNQNECSTVMENEIVDEASKENICGNYKRCKQRVRRLVDNVPVRGRGEKNLDVRAIIEMNEQMLEFDREQRNREAAMRKSFGEGTIFC